LGVLCVSALYQPNEFLIAALLTGKFNCYVFLLINYGLRFNGKASAGSGAIIFCEWDTKANMMATMQLKERQH
jgi:hypothetical protein